MPQEGACPTLEEVAAPESATEEEAVPAALAPTEEVAARESATEEEAVPAAQAPTTTGFSQTKRGSARAPPLTKTTKMPEQIVLAAAQQGLCKLWVELAPEVAELHTQFGALAARQTDVKWLSWAWVLLCGIRGRDGVRWLGQELATLAEVRRVLSWRRLGVAV